ncbi:membrane bound O-acyl transferase family-domain-containing protein [Aspergillus californicus]
MSTILLVGVFLFADEKIPISGSSKRALYFTIITSTIITSALYPPTSLTILNYANVFLSVTYALRLVELLVTHNPSQMKRLERIHDDHSFPVYAWKSMPPALSFRRLVYVCDLLINPRGIGWAHGSKKYLPRLERLNTKSRATVGHDPRKIGYDREHEVYSKLILKDPTRRLAFLVTESLKLIIAYMIYDAYRTFGYRDDLVCTNLYALLNSSALQHFESNYLGLRLHVSLETASKFARGLLSPPACWAASYAFVDGIRASFALFAVGGLYLVSPTLADDPWMYPPVFGSLQHFFSLKLKDIWGKFWHDLCRRALLSTATVIIPRQAPNYLRRTLIGFLSFMLSGVAHAAGTYTVTRDAQSSFVMIIFFTLIPIFIILQEIVTGQILPRFLPDWWITRAVIWILDAAYVLWWGYHTAPWFFRYSMIPEALVSVPVSGRWSLWGSS